MTENFTILLVEDSALMRRLVREMLRSMGRFHIVEASNGQEALEVVRRQRINLIVSDCKMQPMDGIDLLRAINAMPADLRIPFVMMTAEQHPGTIVDAIAAGVSGYLTKPFDREQLAALVQQCLAGGLSAA